MAKKRSTAHQTVSAGPLRVCSYCRVSTGRQAESDLSIPDQNRQIADYVAAKGWELAIPAPEEASRASRMIAAQQGGDYDIGLKESGL